MTDTDEAQDMLQGMAEIAVFTGNSERRTNYLLERKRLPAFKIGNIWHMRKSTYRAFIERLESAAMQAA
jgi:hypothetical protein